MKYVILIRSNPQPWGHPTADFLEEQRALPSDMRARLAKEFDETFAELTERGELVHAEPLGDPAHARLFRWAGEDRVVSGGPYAEGREHLAGFFVIDVESPQRAEAIARMFCGPGETVELRPVMAGGASGG